MAETAAALAVAETAQNAGGAAGAERPPVARAYRTDPDEAVVVGRYVSMVKRCALHLIARLPTALQPDDLVQAGLIAILRLMRQPDGAQLGEAVLRRAVVNAMIDEARRAAWAPTRTVRRARAVAEAMRAVRRRLGRDGSDAEIAAELGLSLDDYGKAMLELAGLSLFDLDAFSEADERALQTSPEQEETLRRQRMTAALAAAVALLPSRGQLVISLYYEHELSMEEVGQVLGLDKSTVSRSHARALLLLRNALADWGAASDGPRLRAAGG